MIKTVKVKKNMRLDELIKYVWENSATEKRVFLGNHGQRVVFDNVGGFYPSGYAYSPDTTFTVEVEEVITKDTKFSGVQEVFKCIPEEALETEMHPQRELISINDVLDEHDEETKCLQIYAKVKGKLELIWEAE